MSIRKPFEKLERKSFQTIGPTMTQQNFKQECDINHILKKYQKTGIIEHANRFQGNYTDLSEVADFQTACNIVIEAQEAFNSLPSSIRKQFSNDPQEFLSFVENPENHDSMIQMGLIPSPEKPIAPEAQTAEPDTPTAPAS